MTFKHVVTFITISDPQTECLFNHTNIPAWNLWVCPSVHLCPVCADVQRGFIQTYFNTCSYHERYFQPYIMLCKPPIPKPEYTRNNVKKVQRCPVQCWLEITGQGLFQVHLNI